MSMSVGNSESASERNRDAGNLNENVFLSASDSFQFDESNPGGFQGIFDHDEDEDEVWLSQERRRHRTLRWYQKPSVLMICLTAFLFTFAHGISVSSKIQLMIDLICRDLLKNGGANEVKCNANPEVQRGISNLESALTVVGNILATVLSGKICEVSDQYGRQKVISAIVATTMISKILELCLILPSVETYHPFLIVLATAIESVGGGTVTFMSLSSAYLSDILEQKDRIKNMGIISGCLFAGMGLGPFIGSLTIRHYNSNVVSCYIDIMVLLILLFFCLTLFPESRSKNAQFKSRRSYIVERDRKLSSDSSSSIHHHITNLVQPLRLLLVPGGLNKRRLEVFNLLFILIFFSLGTVYMGKVFILYPIYVFKWTSVDIGFFVTIMMVSRAIILFCISPIVLRYLNKKYEANKSSLDKIDLIIVRVSLLCEFVGGLVLTFASNSTTYKLSQVITCWGAFLNPVIDSILIKYSPVDKVGQMMGAISMIKNLLAAILPSVLLLTYSSTLAKEPRTVFYLMLLLVGTALIFSLFLKEDEKLSINDDEASNYGTIED